MPADADDPMPDRFPPSTAAAFAIILLLGVGTFGWLGWHGLPCPHGDDAIYKSPAAELVQHGRMAVPCASGFLPQAETTFAAYPPLFQWILGAWYAVFGVSLYSSLAFNYTVHLLGTLAVMEVGRRLLGRLDGVPPIVGSFLVFAVGAIQWGNLRYFDRQEETALLFVWTEVLFVSSGSVRPSIFRGVLSGLLVALAALASPWVGVLAVMIVGFRALLGAAGRHSPWHVTGLHLALSASTAAVVVLAWYVATEWRYPDAIGDQLFGTLGLLKDTQGSGTLREKLAVFFGYTIRYNLSQTPAVLLILTLAAAAILAVGWRRMAPTAVALLLAGTLGIVAVALLRPIAYTYLGAAQIVLLPCLAPAVAWALHRRLPWARWAFPAIAVCVLFAQRDVARHVRTAVELPAQERADAVFDRLAAIIPPGDSVAVRSRHWHVFQGRNPWREAYFSALLSADEVRRCRWLVLPPQVHPDYLDGFELIEQVPSAAPRYRTYAYSLYRRREG